MTDAFAAPTRRSLVPLLWLALGTFAIGTEGFMIAPLLPGLAADLHVGVGTAGQLVSVFALTYAISSPLLTAATGRIDRRSLLIAAMTAFAAANLVACMASGYAALMGARVLLALAAGLYVPSANALAALLLKPGRRGLALSIVSGGTSLAIALGVPLGATIGDRFGWRLTFAGVGLLALLAIAGLLRLPRHVGRDRPVAGLRERLGTVRHPGVLPALCVTLLWATGAYAVYTFLAVFLGSVTAWVGDPVSAILFLWGVSAAVGLYLGGLATDRVGVRPVITGSLAVLAAVFATLSLCAALLPPATARLPVVLAVAIWGVSAWSFFPAQQTRLIAAAGLDLAPVVLSLNASFMFLGFSLGAAAGSVTLARAAPGDLGWVGAICVAAALALSQTITARRAGRIPAEDTAARRSI